MTEQEKLAMLEEMLELDEGELAADMALDDIEEWDSLTKLSFIVLLNEEYEKKITSEQIKAMKTVADMLAHMVK